jgi:protein-disulfide isomerase
MDRRSFLGGLLGLAATTPGRAAPPALAALDGSPMRSFTVADPAGLASAGARRRFGAAEADVVLIEAFDYNCGYCRAAAADLDAMVGADPRLALAPLHLPILSPASLEAARIQTAVRQRHGEAAGRAFHLGLFGLRGFVDAAKARGLALDLGVAVTAAEEAAADAEVQRQSAAARTAGLRLTPTFVLGATAFVGWPGRATMETFVAAMRRCDRPACG